MKLHYLFPLIVLFTAGCSSNMPSREEIQSVDSNHYFVDSQFDHDMKGVSWIAKDSGSLHFNQFEFTTVGIKSSGVDQRVSKQVQSEFKTQVHKKMDEKLATKLQGYKNVVLENKELDISVMLYDINDIPEDMRVTEFIPVGSVIGAIKYAAGTRDRSIRILASVDLKDHDTSQLIGRRIFVVNDNGVLENDKSEITIDMLDKNLEQISQQAVDFAFEVTYLNTKQG
ncbi:MULTISPECIES: DUF3313 family protein [Vibrio]|uniref:DUF3313 family protein n=1 Tax=Vibrio TaxID=662 RepID=UPI000E3299BB|nr:MULTISPECIES: DUF3313 family protein [Vibrio]MCG9568298.1 DUF3313 family protein [Vibrio chagasii]NOI86206.1 DUF3313 family protein [Vibrio sp. 99K-1]CAH6966473.1 conserved hypothetical protein [Vibrio chagasii]CAH7466821.1 conserved hypothetical protein [Vibrio chagasii]